MASVPAIVVCLLGLFQHIHGGGIQEEILNGFNAVKGQFPYQALLLNQFPFKDTTFCGGALISAYHVLTAAHCSYQTNQTKVFLGLTDSNDGTGAFYYFVDPANTFVNRDYNPLTFQNDIAILRLPAAARMSNLIGTIMLPKLAWASPTTFDNYAVTASGWGQTFDTEVGIHRLLQYREINKMAQRSCVSVMSSSPPPVTNNMICTDKQVVYAGPCHGDSGGPLTVQLDTGLYLIGAVSWGRGNCSSTNPVMYANVAYFLSWINSVTGIPIS